MKIKNLALILIVGAVLAGCQNANTGNTNNADNGVAANQQKVYERGTPYSKGPTAAPDSSTGPTSAPPADGQTATQPSAQAVTTNENIRLTLPLKTTK